MLVILTVIVIPTPNPGLTLLTEETKLAAAHFDVPGTLVAVIPINSGNVNDTSVAHFRTSSAETRVVLQRINHRVFADPAKIVENMLCVTGHIHARLDRECATHDRVWQLPRVIRTLEGGYVHKDSTGNCWRALSMIESATAYEIAKNPVHAEEMGRILGQFHRLLSDFDGDRLSDPLPGFHITPSYLARYDRTLTTDAAQQRLQCPAAQYLHEAIEQRRDFGTVLEDAKAKGVLQTRVIHGDPKVSNFMIDDITGKGTSMIDLDTVKPGLIHYDVGDALRSLCNPVGEETRDLDSVTFDLDLCRAFIRGYLVDARDFLSTNDRQYLYDAVRLLTFELSIRFFEDYLAGNVYFKANAADHNLHRASVQLTLCERIEAAKTGIKQILQEEFAQHPAPFLTTECAEYTETTNTPKHCNL